MWGGGVQGAAPCICGGMQGLGPMHRASHTEGRAQTAFFGIGIQEALT